MELGGVGWKGAAEPLATAHSWCQRAGADSTLNSLAVALCVLCWGGTCMRHCCSMLMGRVKSWTLGNRGHGGWNMKCQEGGALDDTAGKRNLIARIGRAQGNVIVTGAPQERRGQAQGRQPVLARPAGYNL